jgi:signal transduction histidine kinase/response regulator of citrate/malate metabolism
MISSDNLWHRMSTLFSVMMILDHNLKIVRSSDCLKHHVPKVTGSPPLTEVFNVDRPSGAADFENLRQGKSLCLLVTRDKSFAIRGQIVDMNDGEEPSLWFVGSPWLRWLKTHRADKPLTLDAFAPNDTQLDQLFQDSVEKRMLRDLEQLNAQLRETETQLREAQAAKNAFFAQVSHEMRTPLNGIVSAVTLLKDENLPKGPATLLELASECSKNLMQVINYVLDVAQLEHVGEKVETIPFDLPDLIASVTGVVRSKAIEKGVQLSQHIDGGLASTYSGDVSRIQQTLLNLVSNAIKFTEQGRVQVNVTTAPNDVSFLRFEVIDTGIGIRLEDQSAIFAPFQKLHRRGSLEAQSGTGLGLDIVSRNVELMGGRIGVISALGEGSNFWFEIPCNIAESKPSSAPPHSIKVDEKFLFKGRVLLVDDNATNLLLGSMILESMGLEVITADCGEKAVELVEHENLDLVLMDISMPGMDGFQATRQIRQSRGSDSLPIVALTAFADSTEIEFSMVCGMNGYITKPIQRSRLAETLSRYVPSAPQPATNAAPIKDSADPVDRDVLAKLARQIGTENLNTVTGKFLNEIESRWHMLEHAETNEEILLEAHTLASSCRSFGLLPVADKLACIERHARFGDTEGEPPSIVDTGRDLKEAADALRLAIKAL